MPFYWAQKFYRKHVWKVSTAKFHPAEFTPYMVCMHVSYICVCACTIAYYVCLYERTYVLGPSDNDPNSKSLIIHNY